MEIHAIVAIDTKGAIGKEGKLPWHIPSELKHFKQLTMGYPIVLGRTTFEGFSKPLPGRDHLVLSRKKLQSSWDNVHHFSSKEELISFCHDRNYHKIFICGGESIYQLFDHDIDQWHISEIHLQIKDADCYLKNEYQKNFNCTAITHNVDEQKKIAWDYKHYLRCK